VTIGLYVPLCIVPFQFYFYFSNFSAWKHKKERKCKE